MKRSQKINEYIYKLLIEKEMDGFSVVEARDTACLFKDSPKETDQVRKIVYRQIRLCEHHGWLRSEGDGREKRYYKTDLFHSLSFESRKKRSIVVPVKTAITKNLSNDYSELTMERKKLKGELEVSLREIEKYQSLKKQYPEQTKLLERLHDTAREQSALFLADIKAITNFLNSLPSESFPC